MEMGHFDRLSDRICMKNNSGFTLLEILAALTILAMAVAVLIQLFSANLRLLAGSEGSLEAALEATAIIRQVAAQKLTEKSWSETTEKGYRADITVSEVQKDRTENMNMKMMEIIIDLHWIQGAKPKILRLATLKLAEKEQKNQ